MRGEAEAESARPVSGGLWSLFSWLRRDDRSCSSDSLSSAGSARTAASFAFLPSPPPSCDPRPHLPRAPATDSYRKRIHDGNLRRESDRDLTLHRKYGLFYGYDAFSLPSARKILNDVENEQDRERRANSESLPRRTAYVPGKRRAPLPPSRPHSITSTVSLTRRHNRKRPAPQPPVRFSGNVKEYEKIDSVVQMNPNLRDRRPLSSVATDDTNECISEKHSKKVNNSNEKKTQKEKSFLKHIFDSKKRNSTIESAPERILPSISELDKQAAEIIKSYKLHPIQQYSKSSDAQTTQSETWFCTRCLRKYDSTVVTCQYCLPEQKRIRTAFISNNLNQSSPSSSFTSNDSIQTEKEAMDHPSINRISGIGPDEKRKLKEMLKEMKDSLPKKSKQKENDKIPSKNVYTFDSTSITSQSLETPTLRIESKAALKELKAVSSSQPSTAKQISETSNIQEIKSQILPKIIQKPMTENVVITQQVVLAAPQSNDNSNCNMSNFINNFETTSSSSGSNILKENEVTKSTPNIENNNLHTPLKISTLLNPVYIPINKEEKTPKSLIFAQNQVMTKADSSRAKSFEQPNKPFTPSQKSSVKAKSVLTSATIAEIVKGHTSKSTEISSDNKKPPSKQEVINLDSDEKNANSKQTIPAVTKTDSSYPTTSTSSVDNGSDKIKLIHNNMTKFTVNQHSRRRDLINQLEQSIVQGDERSAADAAVKLAQLRLSCSVLSFSSQIMADTLDATHPVDRKFSSVCRYEGMKDDKLQPSPLITNNKVNAAVQVVNTAPVCTNFLMKNKKIEAVKVAVQTESASAVEIDNGISHDKIEKNSSAVSSKSNEHTDNNLTTIQVWVEDREATRGPVRLRIPRQAVMGDLRRQAETDLGLVGALQRWIVGRALCSDDRTPLVSLAGPNLSAPFYLCVVQTEGVGASHIKIGVPTVNNTFTNKNADKTSDVYSELVQLEQRALVVNTEPFECDICMEHCAAGGGTVLRECVHTFCRECMSDLVKHCEGTVVGCPAMGCPGVLQEREIRALVTPEEYERWLARGLAAAESGTRNAFHCRTRDCIGWALCDPGVRRFPCPVCKHTNCIPCQVIHEGETCELYRKRLHTASTQNSSQTQTDEGTQALLDNLMTNGEALECPECNAIITKKWGCDWVKCSACKTEICWVTRGRRWGPAGKGDTSGGCRCGVDGKRCHPSCGYCH